MSRPSQITTHPEREEIERQLVDPAYSIRNIAAQFGLSPTSVVRYRNSNLIPRMAAAAAERKARGLVQDGLVLQLIEDIIADLRDMAKTQREKEDYTGAGANLSRILQAINTLVSIAAEERARQEMVIAESEEWTELKTAILGALEPYPEALKAVVDALETT